MFYKMFSACPSIHSPFGGCLCVCVLPESSVQARKHILEIHTRDWNPKMAEPFIDELAEKCVGKSASLYIKLSTELSQPNVFHRANVNCTA